MMGLDETTYLRTGAVDMVLPKLRMAVGQFAANDGNSEFKIGTTANLRLRWAHHKLEDWRDMNALYASKSFNYATKVEKALIAHGREKWPDKIENMVGGGGGLKPGYGLYYVYILLG